ncbi:hypothetical protein ACWYXK_06770 [Janthinobacterium lividum]
MTAYTDRPVTVFELPVKENTVALRPEQAMFKCNTLFIDFGALCFLKRSSERRKNGQGRKVALDSFNKTRASTINSLVNKFLQESATRRLSAATIEARGVVLIKYMDWCDSQGHLFALEGIDEGRAALKGFVAHLRHMSDTQQISNESAHTWQTNLLLTLELHFEILNISLGTNLIVRGRGTTSQTEVPTQERLAKFLSFHETVFNGICELTLDGKPFPFAIEMPEFVGYNDNMMWLFSNGSSWVTHPESSAGNRVMGIDYNNGRVMGIDEVAHLYSSTGAARWYIKKNLASIAKANDDLRSPIRVRFACIANLTFIRIFETVTGANRADVARIEWTEELARQIAKPSAERQGFRTIKARANNRVVFYQIGVNYFPLLRKFLNLRAWLLNGATHECMFFHYIAPEEKSPPGPIRLARHHFMSLEVALSVIYPAFKKIRIGPRKIRAAKQDDTIRKYDPATSAKIMQHSIPTALRHYSNGSSEVAREEMSNFLQEVHVVMVEGRHLDKIEEERATGGCISKNNPRSISADPAVQPDCKRSEGCLFCDKYRAHADVKDVRKLLSAKFVVEQTSALAGSVEEYDRVFGTIIMRIDHILLEICDADISMTNTVERISKEVAKGELDDYWSTKMEELLEAGIL